MPEVRRELDALTTNGEAQKSKADPKNAQPSDRGAGLEPVMTNFMKRAADAVVDKLLELMQRDRAAQEAKPKSAESPLIVIPIPKWRTYFALAFITVFFLGLVCRAVGCRQ